MMSLRFIFMMVFVLVTFDLFAYQKDKLYKITILHTNDNHGNFWKNKYGEGGMAARMTLVTKIRQEAKKNGSHVLLLSGGDVNTGTPVSSMLNGMPDFKGMSLMKYDGMAIGNHEFDNSFGVIKQQMKWANFPFLSANTFNKNDGSMPFVEHLTKKFDQLNIAIVGFTTPDASKLTLPENSGDFIFKPVSAIAPKLISRLREKSDMLIVVGHLGYYENALHYNRASGDITLARKTKGIDVIIGGHTHTALEKVIIENGVIISQAGKFGQYLGRMDLEFLNGKVSLKKYRLIPVNLKKKVIVDGKKIRKFIEKEIKEDEKMLDLLSPFMEMGKKKLDAVIGRINGPLNDKSIRDKRLPLGNLITLIMKEASRSDLAILNSGSIRSGLEKGKITYRDILRIHPFGNTICTVSFTGKELTKYIKLLILFRPGEGAFPQCAGVEINSKNKKLISLKVGGRKVVDEKMYKLAVSSFIAVGRDGYPNISKYRTYRDTGITIDGSMKAFFNSKDVLDARKY